MNNDKAQEFVITVWREESNEVGNEVHDKSNQVEDLDTGLRYSNTDLDTGLRHSDTDLDTGLRHSNTDLDTQLRHSDTPKVSLSNKQRDIVISVQFLEPPKRYLTELVSVCIPRTVSVTSPPLLQQDICR